MKNVQGHQKEGWDQGWNKIFTFLCLAFLLSILLSASVQAASKPISGYVLQVNSSGIDNASVIVYVNQTSISSANPCYTSPTVATGSDGSYATNLGNLKRNDNGNDCSGLWATGDTIWAQGDGSTATHTSKNGTSAVTTISSGTGLQTLGNITVTDSVAPNVTLLLPANTTINANGSVTFQFNVTDNSNISNCSLLFDGLKNQSNTSITVNTTNDFSRTNLLDNIYNWSITCRDLQNNTGNSSTFRLNVSKVGSLVVSLVSPTSSSSVLRKEYFSFQVQMSCLGGDCGNVNASLDPLLPQPFATSTGIENSHGSFQEWLKSSTRIVISYLKSSTQVMISSFFSGQALTGLVSGSLVPTTTSTPFWTNSSNPLNSSNYSCLSNMQENDLCNVTWRVNASGGAATSSQFFAYANSTSNTTIHNLSSSINITIIENATPSVPDMVPPAGTSYNFSNAVAIAANVTDETNVSRVYANITYPNSTIRATELSLESGSRYAASWNVPSLNGTYNITIVANDSSNNYNISQRTNITAHAGCGPITQDVRLDQNITSGSGTCLSLAASRLTFDCQGGTISYGTGGAVGYGINNSGGYDNLTIRNCNITQASPAAGSSGLYLVNMQNSTFENVTIVSADAESYGVLLHTTQGNVFKNVVIRTNGTFAIFDNTSGADTFIYNTSDGLINWTLANLSTNVSLQIGNTIFLSSNLVGFTDDPLVYNLDGAARIEIRGQSYTATPQLLKDGTRCDNGNACNISYDTATGILSASISSFSNYTTTAASSPSSSSGSSSGGSTATIQGGAGKKKKLIPLPVPPEETLPKVPGSGFTAEVTSVEEATTSPTLDIGEKAFAGAAIGTGGQIQSEPVVQMQTVTVALKNNGPTNLVLRPELVLPPVDLSLIDQQLLQKIEKKVGVVSPEEGNEKLQRQVLLHQLLEKEDAEPLLGRTAHFLTLPGMGPGLLPTGSLVAGNLLLPKMIDDKEITLQPGESIDKEVIIQTFGLQQKPLTLRFTSEEGESMEQQVQLSPSKLVGTALDYDQNTGAADMYVIIPPGDAPQGKAPPANSALQQQRWSSPQQVPPQAYWVEYTLSTEGDALESDAAEISSPQQASPTGFTVVGSDSGRGPMVTADLLGPYYVSQGDSLLLVQQFATQNLPPEDYVFAAKVYRGNKVVAEQEATFTTQGQEITASGSPGEPSSIASAIAGMADEPGLDTKAAAGWRNSSIILFILAGLIIIFILWYSSSWFLNTIIRTWQASGSVPLYVQRSSREMMVQILLQNKGQERTLEAWAFLITPQQFQAQEFQPALAITAKYRGTLGKQEEVQLDIPLPLPILPTQPLPPGEYVVVIYAREPAQGQYRLLYYPLLLTG